MSDENKDIVEAVKKEIESLGDNMTKNYDTLRTNYEELKHSLDEKVTDVLLTEKIDKFSTDITVRQEEIDKQTAKQKTEINERMDKIEVVLKRTPRGENKGAEISEHEVKDFGLAVLAGQAGDNGVNIEKVKDFSVTQDEYGKYCTAFQKWARRYGGEKVRSLDPESQKDLQVGIDVDGGITVTDAMSKTIIKRLFETDPIRELADSETITTGALTWLAEWDDNFGFGWEGETLSGTKTTTPTFKEKRIPTHVMYAKTHASQTLLEDSGINIERWLAKRAADKFARGEAVTFVTGSGVQKPRGFTTYPNGTDYGTVEQVNMGAAAALTADGFYDLLYSLKEFYLNSCTFLMNRTTVQAALKLKDGVGNYIWQPSFQKGEPASLLNRPVRMSTTMPVVAANALSVALADWKQAYMIVDRLGLTLQRDPFTVKPMIEFYFRKRLGADVIGWDAIKLGKIAV